jgi:DNA-binding XRE family transcriptional regulator
MKLSDLHRKLSGNRSYRAAYEKLGDSVILSLHFRAARESARLTRGQLARDTQLTTGAIAAIEDDFDFHNERAVSLIADRLESHLVELGVCAPSLFVPGGRLADLPPPTSATERKPFSGFVAETPSAPESPRLARLRNEAIPENQLAILRRVAAGQSSPRDAVRDLIELGVIQPRAELLISLFGKG